MITIEKIREEVIRLGTEYPEALYIRPNTKPNENQGCYYDRGDVQNGPPDKQGCIFGQALQNLDPEFLQSKWAVKRIGISELLFTLYGISCPQSFNTCQGRQDDRNTWGDAIKAFQE